MHAMYLKNPEGVDPSWRYFFEGMSLAAPEAVSNEDLAPQIYRKFGHRKAQFNPLQSKKVKALKLPFIKEPIDALESIYCNQIGFECTDLYSSEMEEWIQKQIEERTIPPLSADEKQEVLQDLIQAETFEAFLHTKYVGQTRFSLEGGETTIPLIKQVIESSGASEAFIGMAHRGRLNVEAQILGKPYPLLFQQFENDLVLSEYGQNDVKYHMGYTGSLKLRSGQTIQVTLPSNPSHLESINPVLLGIVKGTLEKRKLEPKEIVPILIHGDASVAGQGVVYETLQLMRLNPYFVGGTIHIVINNQIGYTTSPEDGRSTPYCTDIAKTFQIPIFHVNAEDPESVLFVAKLAGAIRKKFGSDVFIDLLSYRKYGHNEGDEPSYTQPIEYQEIKSKKPISEIYAEKNHLSSDIKIKYQELLQKSLDEAKGLKITPQKPHPIQKASLPAPSKEVLRKIALQAISLPSSFTLHTKLKQWIESRKKMIEEGSSIDWSFAECLAFGSLLAEKIPIRLSGEDVQRGTFSQRHIVFIDGKTGQSMVPLNQIGKIQTINSPLTEFGGLGFEYGYSLGDPAALVLWEAQYGDFNNGAQIIIDQYLASGEEKWNQHSSLVMLLPHGYEGAGPEHSSARVERFLQLAALNNLRVANPSNPAQYFHLLRRQALFQEKKPLIVLTPKSLLRSPQNVSPFNDLCQGAFQEVIDHGTDASVTKVICCSGKIYYDLMARNPQAGVITLEQIYPFSEDAFAKALKKYAKATSFIWLQEEPKNMGIWPFFAARYPQFTYVGRPSDATPSTGSHKKHKLEQEALLDQALGNTP
jgi:2-oxoglutarate dehydrogenase E1 component